MRRALLVLTVCGLGPLLAPACSKSFSSSGNDENQGGEANGTGGKGGKGGTTGGTMGDAGESGDVNNAGSDSSGGTGGKGGSSGSSKGGSGGSKATGGKGGGSSAAGGSGGDVTAAGGSGGDVTATGGSAGDVTATGGSAGDVTATGGSAGTGGGKGGTGGKGGAGGNAGNGAVGGKSGAGGGGPGGTGGTGGLCTTRIGSINTPSIFQGATGSTECGNTLDAPYTGTWRPLSDGTATVTAQGQLGGQAAAVDCGMRIITNPGGHLTDWGGGAGFGLNMLGSQFCPFDATALTGLRFYIKGTTSGTAGDDLGGAKANTVRLAVATRDTASVDEGGTCVTSQNQDCSDHYGGYCTFASDSWTNCGFTLSDNTLTRLGSGPDVLFNKSRLVEILFEVRRASSAPQLTFDFMVDQVEFY